MNIHIILGILVSTIVLINAHASKRASVTSQIRFLLDEEKTLREKLELRVQTLRERAAILSKSIGKFIQASTNVL